MEIRKQKWPSSPDEAGRGSRAGAAAANQITKTPTTGYAKPISAEFPGQSARSTESRKNTQARIANLAARGRWGDALALAEGRLAHPTRRPA